MAVNRGKKFEEVIKEAFERVPDTSVVRLHDQTNGYLGGRNHCDFIVYHKPLEYHIECKSVHGNTLPFSNITDNQWQGLLEKSKIKGVVAGVICWWVDKDVTAFFPIQMLKSLRDIGDKSISYKGDWTEFYDTWNWHWIEGKKKRVFFDYDMSQFLSDVIGDNNV